MRFSKQGVYVAISALLLAARADAQLLRGDISLGGGTATDQRGIHSSAVTIAPSLLFVPNAQFSAGLSGSATRFGSSANAYGGGGSIAGRIPAGSVLSVAAAGAASMTMTSFNASYSSAELTPTIEGRIGGATLYGGVRALTGTARVRDATSTPGGVFSNPVAGARDVTSSRTSTGPVFGAVVDVDRATGAKLGYREEHARVAGVTVSDRVATGMLGDERFAISALAGLRDAPDERLGFASVTATYALARGVALQAAAGSYPSNRVTGTFGGSFASIGLSLRGLRRLDAEDDALVVRGAPAVAAGLRRLAIKAEGARRVEIAGDWNRWTPTPAIAAADGTWYSDVRLPPGEHRYAFRIDGARWMVPEGVASVDDGFGGRSALVTVH